MRDDFLALDLSLTSTGGARYGETFTIKSKLRGTERLREILEDVMTRADRPPQVRLVIIEGYAMGGMGRVFDIGELGGVIKLGLLYKKLPVAIIPPSSLKKFATGKGNAKKDDMLEAAIRYFDFTGHGNDEADAWLLLKMAEAAYGDGGTNAKQREAIASVTWPDLSSE